MRRKWSVVITVGSLVAGLIAFTIAQIWLPAVPQYEALGGNPSRIGRLNAIDIYYHVGDVALPNRLLPMQGDGSRALMDQRIRHWDSFLITAPVPEKFTSSLGDVLQVPWTQLPMSVVSIIAELDKQTAAELAKWLAIDKDESEWYFERLSRFDVSPKSSYGRVCGITSIYTVNMFNFVSDWGRQYDGRLRDAVSTAVKEVVEQSGRDGNKALCIPALAGAEHIVEKQMVLTYAETFEAILDGVGRVSGEKPAKVILVVWHTLKGHREFTSAVSGLEVACYKSLPSWKSGLKAVSLWTGVGALLLGIMLATILKLKGSGIEVRAIVLLALIIVPTLAGNYYFSALMEWMLVTPHLSIEMGLLAVVLVWVGAILVRLDIVSPPQDKLKRQGQQASAPT